MINTKKASDFLEEYKKIYDSTKVEKCTLAPLFLKLFEKSKDTEIIKD